MMKGVEKKRSPSVTQARRYPRSERRDSKLQQENTNKNLKAKETDVKALSTTKQGSLISLNNPNNGTVISEIYEDVALNYLDDKSSQDSDILQNSEKAKRDKGESDSETINDSVSSHEGSQILDDESIETISITSKVIPNAMNDLQIQTPHNTPVKSTNSSKMANKNMKVHPKSLSESSEEGREVDITENTESNDIKIGESDDETEKNAALSKKIENLEMRVEKLEEELREVAALEISLYSVLPNHATSAHKLHAPARRLSRLYIHACKHWSQEKRATIAKNSVSGLVMIAKSCGNDVPKLTFWLSNMVVLRQIVTRAFGTSCQSSSLAQISKSNGTVKRSEAKYSAQKLKYNSASRQLSKNVSLEFMDNWQETITFTTALEIIESWIFSRIVESIWWQALTPNMQSPSSDSSKLETTGRFLGPALGDPTQGSFSVDLWKDAFGDAFKRLCPIRAGGNECGCLSILAKMVMEQCIERLDVAMFNAILRESAHEIPTDPVSDPIVDPKVLPIPAGDLSFGSGAQLKNSVGNWSRWLTDLFNNTEKFKCFNLLNSLSDLLMLPKDMLMDRLIRTEVCPLITLPLLKRILCNFTPDEFCPDSVPGTVLEAVNAECIVERRVLGDTSSSFPYKASPTNYKPPPQSDIDTNTISLIQRKGYTSDEELDEHVSPLDSIIETSHVSPNGRSKEHNAYNCGNLRYELLREVWLA
jgi:hypothetical protein